jgi:hypothetical protein
MTTIGAAWWVVALSEVAGVELPPPVIRRGDRIEWRKSDAEAFVATLRENLKTRPPRAPEVSETVGLSFWADFYGTTTTTISDLVRKGRRGRGWDARLIPPLDIPGHARWRRVDAIAHVQSLKSEAA